MVDESGAVRRRPDLTGRTVGVTADRRGEEQAVMFRRLGAEVVHGPTMSTHKRVDDATLRAVTESLIERPADVVVANTGLGMRTWLAAAEDWGASDALLGSLGSAAIVCRGPKVDGAIKSAGLRVAWRAPSEQLSEVGEHLLGGGSQVGGGSGAVAAGGRTMEGVRVAVQLHGDGSAALTDRLRAAGAEVVEVPVYSWAGPADSAPARSLLEAAVAGELDAVTFTAGPQVRGLVALAEAEGRAATLVAALNSATVVGCIGPVCAAVAQEEGIGSPVVPEHWRLGALVTAVASALARP